MSPFLVCDPYPIGPNQPDCFMVKVDEAEPVKSPAQKLLDGTTRLYFDLGALSPGTHLMEITARVDAWGEESVPIPFGLSRPALVASPTGIGLLA